MLRVSKKLFTMAMAFMMVLFIALALTPATIVTAIGTTYYVSSSTGNDSNNGISSSTPWKTLPKVSSSTFAAGDTICLKAGDQWNESLTLSNSGTAVSPILLTSYGTGARPVINPGISSGNWCVKLSHSDGWKITGIEMCNAEQGILIWYLGDACSYDYVDIEDCYFHDIHMISDSFNADNNNPYDGLTWGAAVYQAGGNSTTGPCQYFLTNLIMKHCVASNCDSFFHNENIYYSIAPPYCTFMPTGVNIDGCTFINCAYNTVHFGGCYQNNILQNCVFTKNGRMKSTPFGGCDLIIGDSYNSTVNQCEFGSRERTSDDGDGCAIDFEFSGSGYTVSDCYFHDNSAVAIEFTDNLGAYIPASSNVTITGNLFVHDSYNSPGYYAEINDYEGISSGTTSYNTFYLLDGIPAYNHVHGVDGFTHIDDVNGNKSFVATPIADVYPGTYNTAQTVSLSCSTSGAVIYYTTDGSIPTTSSTLYTGPISVSNTCVLNAKAFLSGYEDSYTSTNLYAITSGLWTVVNDADSSISYGSGWGYNDAASGFINSDCHSSNTSGSYVQYTFTGTGIKVIGDKDNNHGMANIYIDGFLAATVDSYNSTVLNQQNLYTITGLASGIHTIKVEISNNKNSSSSNYYQSIDAFKYIDDCWTVINDADSSISYGSGWSYNDAASGFINNDCHSSNTPGSYVEYTFTGTGIKVMGEKGNNYGMANIYIDGNLVTTVDSYSTLNLTQQVLYSNTGLSNDVHIIKVEISSSKNASSSDYNQSIDVFKCINDSWIAVNDADSSISYGSGWGYNSIASGFKNEDCHSSNISGSYVEYTFTGTGIKVIGDKGTNHGKANIYIDDNFIAAVDSYSIINSVRQNLYVNTSLTSGTHTIKVEISSSKNARSSDYYQSIDEFKYINDCLTVVNDADSSISYGSGWGYNDAASGFINSDCHSSNTSGSYVQYTFTGTCIKVIGDKDSNHGMANIYIDGNFVTTVDSYNSTALGQQDLYENIDLASGTHTIKVEISSSKNTNSSDYYQSIDAFKYK